VVSWALIALNVWVFLYELALGPELEAFVQRWGFIPARYFLASEVDPSDWVTRYAPLLTSMFLHGGGMHLIGNMIYLWIFGDNVEDRLGHGRYLALYVLTGVGAGLVHAYLYPQSTVPTVGASGAISGVLGAYLVLFPFARVLTFVPLIFFLFDVVELPAALYLGIWFLMQLLSGTLAMATAADAAGVAWWAHVGGFVAGMVLVTLLRRPDRSVRVWRDQYAPW
jgi:membrane associated rhomboid family serine protease